MTSATDHDAHPDVIEISDLAEDLLPAERAARLRAHVDSCPQCTEVLDSLREIATLLGGLPQAEPMPAEVVARIDAALAAEAATAEAGSTPAADMGPVSSPPHVPRGTSLPAQDRPRADVPRGTSRPAGRPSEPAGPGRGDRRRRGLLIAALSVAGALAVGTLLYQLPSGGTSSNSSSGSDSAASVRGGAQGAGASAAVGADVARLLGGGESAKSGGSHVPKSPMLGSDGSTTVTAPDGSATSVPTCVLNATRRTERPLAAQREPFQGVDSYLVVLPDPAEPDQVDAIVLTAACTADTPARVLFQNSYPRP